MIIGSSMILSCDKKDEVSKSSYFSYSVNGATCNGEFILEDDKDASTFNAVATIVPELGERPETVVLTYTDYVNNRIVTCYLPAKKTGPILMTADSDFKFFIADNAHSCSLYIGVESTALGVDVEVTRFDRESNTVKRMEAHFEGIMSYENVMGAIEMHTIKGDLYYDGIL
jgi:hypothetical protein